MSNSEFLYARPSFLEGWARVGDLGNSMTEFNSVDTPAEADQLALASDWAATGSHVRDAILRARDEILASRA